MTFPQFSFVDFCLPAGILVILGGFSFLEVLIPTALKRDLDEKRMIPLQKAASWSVVGAIVTLIAGALAQSFAFRYADSIAITIPLGFLIRWGVLHMRGTSVMNVKYLEEEADQYYLILIENVVRGNADNAVSTQDDRIFTDCGVRLIGDPPWWAITAVFRHGKSLVSGAGLESLLGRLSFTHEKFDELVHLLVKQKRLRRSDRGELLPPTVLSLPKQSRENPK
jgi:hypothetical protein